MHNLKLIIIFDIHIEFVIRIFLDMSKFKNENVDFINFVISLYLMSYPNDVFCILQFFLIRGIIEEWIFSNKLRSNLVKTSKQFKITTPCDEYYKFLLILTYIIKSKS